MNFKGTCLSVRRTKLYKSSHTTDNFITIYIHISAKTAFENFPFTTFLPAEKPFAAKHIIFVTAYCFGSQIPLSMPKITRKNIAPLHDLITVQVSKEDYHYNVEKALKKVSREVSFPGFREGRAPASLVRKVHGGEVLFDVAEDKAIDLLERYIKEQSLDLFAPALLYASPEEDEVTVENMGTYEFVYEIALRPKMVPVFPDKNTLVTRYKIEVTEERIAEDLEDLLADQATLEEVPAVETEKDILFLTETGEDFEELSLEELEEHWEPCPVEELSDELQQQAMGVKAGDKFFWEPNEEDDGEDATDDFCYVLKVVRYKNPTPGPEVYEASFPGQSVTTEAAFKEAIRQQSQYRMDQMTEERFSGAVLESIVRLNPIALPAEFLKRSLITEEEDKAPDQRRSVEELMGRYPTFEHNLQKTLTVKSVADALGVQVAEAEIRPAMMARFQKTFENLGIPYTSKEMEEITDRQSKDDNNKGAILMGLYEQKVLPHLVSRITVEEKEIEEEAFYDLPEQVEGDSRQQI